MLGLASALLVVAGALAAAIRLTERRAELALAFATLAAAMVAFPVHALGFAGALGRTSALLGPGSVGAAALIVSVSGRAARGAVLRGVARFVRLPASVVRTAARRRSVALAAIVCAALVVLHALWSGWLLPNDGWDGIWYHDTIIGGALDAGGYAPIALPPDLLQQANGFPRSAEATSLWLACVLDRRIVEWTNTLAALPLFVATYAVVRRFARRRTTALGLASLVVLVPGCALELRSTYVDVYAAAWLVAATYYATRPVLSARVALLGAVSLALLATAKSSAIVPAPILGLLLCVRLLRSEAPRRALLAGGVAAALALAFAATYARNAVLFGNPLWPYAVEAPRLGIAWPGVVRLADADVNVSTSETLAAVFAPHRPGHDFADVRVGGYGEAFAWIALPLAMLGLAVAALRTAPRRRASTRASAKARALLVVAAPALLGSLMSPALWSARYHLGTVALLMAPAAYVLDRPRRRALGEAVLAVATLLAIAHLARLSPPLGGASITEIASYTTLSPRERAARSVAEWAMAPDVARARDRELGAGTSVAFGDGIAFPSVLYDERFAGHLEYVPETDAAAIDAHIARARPTWIVASPKEPLHRYATQRSELWERIGLASRNAPTVAFRRRARQDDAAAR